MTFLSVRDVHKGFDGVPVLRGMSVDVARHEVVALIGASGSGKSTLLRCIDGLVEVDAGTIRLEDDDPIEISAPDVDLDQVRRRVGIVFQQYNLFPHMSVIDNITLAPRKVLKLSRDEAKQRGSELLARFGLEDKSDEYPDRLSGGQQQRVAIVRALAMRPELMLFDEVTSALDPQLVGEVLEVIKELKDAGMTILMATHEMGFARDVADTVCYLADGRVWESGPAHDFFDSPTDPRTRDFLARVSAWH
ncbi:MAG: amino acid ABC transporter ATP-binding protein [Candidatus Nanopelagicales bacterium]